MGEPNVVITPQRWADKVVEMIDGAAWRCLECGWLGEHLYGVEAAQREAGRHFEDIMAGGAIYGAAIELGDALDQALSDL